MATRLNGNKGYFSLVLGEALMGSIQTGLTLSLINLPLGLLTAALDFSAVMAGGIIRGPKTAAVPPEQSPAVETPTLPQKTSLFRRGKNFLKGMGVYFISSFKDPDHQVGYSAAGAGLIMCFQAMWGLETLITSHSALTIAGMTFSLPLGLGIGVCAAFGALGLTAVIAGNMQKGKGLNKYYHKAAGKELPPQPASTKEKGAIRKFFDRPVANAIKKTVLLAMTIESSLFAFGSASSVIYQKAAAMVASPQAILPGILPLAIALKWGGGAAWYLISAGRVTARSARGKKERKTTTTTETVVRPAEQQAAPSQNATPLEKGLTEDFENAVQKQKPAAPVAPQQKPQINPNL